MKRSILWQGSALIFSLSVLLILSGCRGKHADTIKRVEQLMDQKQYVVALDDLTAEIRKDPKDVKLKRLRVILLIRYERVDMAFDAYRELEKISTNDPVLLDALKDKDPKVRAGAARVLGFVGTDTAVKGLERLLNDPDRDVRRAAVAALGEIRDKKATPGLIAALKDEWWFVRSDAAQALGKIRDVSAVEPLFQVMSDSDSSVQLAAENAILTMCLLPGAPKEVFAKYAQSSNPEAQRVAWLALATLKDSTALNGLLQLAASPDARKRAQATRALGALKDPEALPALRKAATDPLPVVRLQAIEALGEFRDAPSTELLKKITNDEKQPALIRRAAVIALLKIRQIPTGSVPAAP